MLEHVSWHLLASNVLFEIFFKYNVIREQVFKLYLFVQKICLVGKKGFLNSHIDN